MGRLLIFVALSMGLVSAAAARDIFVDNAGGDDRRDGSSPEPTARAAGPCRTIARALELSEPSGRIILAKTDEPYRESITLQAGRHSGSRDQPFTILGGGATLDGLQVVPERAWEHATGDVFRFRPRRLTSHLLYLAGKPAVRRAGNPAGLVAGLQPLEWCTFDNYVHFRVEDGKLPHVYDLSFTALPVGITLYEVRHVVIRDLVIQGFQLDGVNAHDNAVDVSLVGLNCRGNGRAGISVGGVSRVTINSCLVGNNGSAQVRTEGSSQTRIVNSDLLDNTAPALVREGGLVTQVDKDGSRKR